eukprot:1887106-Prymnesium_polylepis.2
MISPRRRLKKRTSEQIMRRCSGCSGTAAICTARSSPVSASASPIVVCRDAPYSLSNFHKPRAKSLSVNAPVSLSSPFMRSPQDDDTIAS